MALNQRLRVGLETKSAPFQRVGADAIRCNGRACAAVITTRTDDELEAAMYAPVWHAMHWKTYLCTTCQRRAAHNSLALARGEYCVSCQDARCGVVVALPLNGGAATVHLCPQCIGVHDTQLGDMITRSALSGVLMRVRDDLAARAAQRQQMAIE